MMETPGRGPGVPVDSGVVVPMLRGRIGTLDRLPVHTG
jgi:hypothetical protein